MYAIHKGGIIIQGCCLNGVVSVCVCSVMEVALWDQDSGPDMLAQWVERRVLMQKVGMWN